MSSDLQIKLGLDASELMSALSKAIADLNKAIATINNTKVDINEGPIIADMNKIQAEAKDTGEAIDKSLSGGEAGGGVDALKGKIGSFKDMLPSFSGGLNDLGGSFQSLTGGVTSLIPGLGSLSGVLAGGGITAGIAAIGGGIAYSIDKGKEFETQLASLSSITGVSGSGLTDLGDKAKVMASKFGTDATANIESFKTILSKLGPDIAKSPEALNSMAESVNTLSKATGDDPGKATEALTGALLQFGVSLEDPVKAADAMSVAMNILAAGAKEGASEVPDVAAAINVAGVAAKSAKVSFEETNSAIQILAAGGKVGSEAGTSLRNVLNKLGEGRFLPKDASDELKKAGVDINKLGDTSISLSERLRELNKISGDSALKTKLFGADAAAASILIAGANKNMDELTQKLTGTNTAYDQAAINMATFDESLNRIKSNIDNFAISFYDGMKMSFGMLAESTGPAVGELMTNIGGWFSRMWSVVQPILAALSAILMIGISNAINIVVGAFNVFYEMAVYAFDGVMNAIAPLVDAIQSALGMDGAAGESIDVVKILQDVMNGLGAVIGVVFDVITTLGKIILDVLIGGFTNTIKVITAVGEMFAAFGKWIGELIMKIPGVKSVFEGLKSAFDSVYNFFSNLPKVITEVQVYLKAFGYVFQGIFNILGDSFDKILKLDFSGAKQSLAQMFDSSTWSGLFADGQQRARKELSSTVEAAKKAGVEFKTFQEDTTTGGGGGGGGDKDDKEKKEKEKKDAFEALENLKKQYNARALEIDNANARELMKSKLQGEELKKLQNKLDLEAQNTLKEYLNDKIGKVKDAGVLLEGQQLTAVLKPASDKQMLELESFYVSEMQKLSKVTVIEPKYKLPDFKDVVKEFEALAKDIEKTASVLIPVQPVDNEEALDEVKGSVTKYVEFIKIQNEEITNARTEAILAGNQAQADALQQTIESNNRQINSLENRFAEYQKKSRKEIENSSIYNRISNALSLSILDQFNAEKIKKERETNIKIRDEKLAALNTEEADLQKSLADRSISFEEYASRVDEINKQRANAEESVNFNVLEKFKTASEQAFNTVAKQQSEALTKSSKDRLIKQTALDEAELAQKKKLEGLKGQEGTQAFMDAQSEYEKAQKAASENDAKVFGIRTSALEDFAGNAIAQFGELAASGKATLADFGNAAAGAAFDAVSKMIPSFVAGILGNSVTTLGPILGPLAAAALTGTLYGLLGLARSAAGFKDGVVSLEGAGTETSDSIPAWLSRGESVITAKATKANTYELEWMNKTGKNISEYYLSNAPISNVLINEDGNIVEELKRLRIETKNLGKQITRRTIVEVSGELSADSKSIKAIIDTDKRRNARRF